jgi:hypothetical protein
MHKKEWIFGFVLFWLGCFLVFPHANGAEAKGKQMKGTSRSADRPVPIRLPESVRQKPTKTMSVDPNGGRDHHPGAFCSLLAGAGIKAGQVYGSSDKMGHGVQDDPVSVSDFNRTIAAAAGLPLDQEIIAPNGRPFKVGGDGTPVTGLLS